MANYPATATTFEEARRFILNNVWGQYLNPTLLRDVLSQWVKEALVDVLNPNNPEQIEALSWTVPSAAVKASLPTSVGDQTQSDLPRVIEVVSRTIERLENVDSFSVDQTNAILAAYNNTWAA